MNVGIISWSLNGKDLGIGFELGDYDKNIKYKVNIVIVF
jgi:hypothetical protein